MGQLSPLSSAQSKSGSAATDQWMGADPFRNRVDPGQRLRGIQVRKDERPRAKNRDPNF